MAMLFGFSIDPQVVAKSALFLILLFYFLSSTTCKNNKKYSKNINETAVESQVVLQPKLYFMHNLGCQILKTNKMK